MFGCSWSCRAGAGAGGKREGREWAIAIAAVGAVLRL